MRQCLHASGCETMSLRRRCGIVFCFFNVFIDEALACIHLFFPFFLFVVPCRDLSRGMCLRARTAGEREQDANETMREGFSIGNVAVPSLIAR